MPHTTHEFAHLESLCRLDQALHRLPLAPTPATLNEHHINEYLTYLANVRNVAASTQDQAKNAIVFLYQHVLKIDLGNLGEIPTPTRPKRLPVVLSKQ